MRPSDRTLARTMSLALATILGLAAIRIAAAADAPPTVNWHGDYATALDQAYREDKMLVIFFHDPRSNLLDAHFESRVLGDEAIRARLAKYVCAKLPTDTTVRVDGRDAVLIEDPTFQPMEGRPGVAFVDCASRDARYYGCVVGAFPFAHDACYSVQQMGVILDLPPGTLDQRRSGYVARIRRLACEPCNKSCPSDGSGASPAELAWRTDYAEAHQAAQSQGRMLLVLFARPDADSLGSRFEREVLDGPEIRKMLSNFVLAKLPTDAKVQSDGKTVQLLASPAFSEMLGKEGVAIIDFAHKDARFYGSVVSTFPFLRGRPYSTEQTLAMLTLPPGTLTQRTLIYAVRTHPERPASTEGQIDPNLAQAAEDHSEHQATIRVQGHHNWGTRFHRLNNILPRGLLAKEVCAESWPGEGLLEAAIDCVACWRHSSGHWSAVRSSHPVYGYDMKKGANGIWYATGIFGAR